MLRPKFDNEKDHYFGYLLAPVELVMYGDFQCPYCAGAYEETKMLQEVMGNQLKFVFRHYPLPNLHPMALDAAVAAEVASLRDKFWEMHDALFENQKYLSRPALLDLGEQMGLDMTLFEDSRGYRRLARKVTSDFEGGVASGVSGTPTFFVNGLKYNGPAEFRYMQRACRYLLHLQEAELGQPSPN
jgi:protein-disulfide isomerase